MHAMGDVHGVHVCVDVELETWVESCNDKITYSQDLQ